MELPCNHRGLFENFLIFFIGKSVIELIDISSVMVVMISRRMKYRIRFINI